MTGAIHAARQAGLKGIIAFDMGGTSTDVCLINDSTPLVTTENSLNNLPVAVPMIDIVTVGAGGGSIARLDKFNMLHVGPQSAGAMPGPACYGHGGQHPTVTDANLLRDIIRGKGFAGGKFKLDPEASHKVIAQLGAALGGSAEAAAEAVMRDAISAVPDGTYRGVDRIDSDGLTNNKIKIHLAVTVNGDSIALDFDGTSEQVRSAINCPRASTISAAYSALKMLLTEPGIPLNDDSCRPSASIRPLAVSSTRGPLHQSRAAMS